MKTHIRPKRVLAFVLTLVMAASLLCIPSFAAGAKNKDAYQQYEIYTCLGDSNAAGYAAEGYTDICTRTPGAYHSMVADAIDAELLQYGWGGFRTQEMRHLLDPDYTITDWTYADNCAGKVHLADLEAKRDGYVQAVIDADVITVEIGLNDIFGEALRQIMTELYATPETSEAAQAIKDKLEQGGDATAALLKAFELAQAAGKMGDVMAIAASAFNTAYTQFKENWDAIVKNIYILNPDVTLMAIGMFNPLANMSLNEGDALKIGKLAEPIIALMNTYMKTTCQYSSQYIYVDITDTQTGEIAYNQEDFWQKYLPAVHPTAEGHRYIADQVLDALPTYFPFTDVAATDWCYNDVKYCFENGLMIGTTKTTFSPDSTMTRGMVATVLYRINGSPDVSGLDNPFSDVASDRFCTDAVKWAYANGVVLGYEDGTFKPDQFISRQQFATMLYRYACAYGYADPNASQPLLIGYTDALSVAEYAKPAMRWAVANRIVLGKTLTTLVPEGDATRAQCATMLARFDRNIVNA